MSSPRYTIIRVTDPGACESIINGLWERNLPYAGHARFAWLYRENPAGPAQTWLARWDETGEFVGCGSVYPWSFHVSGQTVNACVATDFGIDRQHRVFGPAVSIQKAITASMDAGLFDVALVYPNKSSSGVFERAGYLKLGVAHDWVCVLRSAYKLRTFLGRGFLTRVVGWLVDQELRLIDLLNTPRACKAMVTETVTACDARFDELWERARDWYRVAPQHTSETINWRYSRCATASYRFFCMSDAATQRLCGYVCYTVQDKAVLIKDIIPAPHADAVSLVALFIRAMRNAHYDCITLSYFGNDGFKKILHRFLFFRRETVREYLVYISGRVSSDVRSALLQPQNYFFFFG